jgi:hypothetical protein
VSGDAVISLGTPSYPAPSYTTNQPTNHIHILKLVYFAFCPIPKPNWLDQSAEMTTTPKTQKYCLQ